MLLKYFRSNRLSVYLVIPLIMLACWIPAWTGQASMSFDTYNAESLFGQTIHRISESNPALADAVAVLLIMANGFLLVQLNTVHIFLPGRTEFPALFYMLICATFPSLNTLSPALPASLLILLVLFRVFSTYKQEKLTYNYLDAGIMIALASFFYVPALLFYPFLFFVLSYIRPVKWREWAFTLIGLALPYVFLYSWYFLNDMEIPALFGRLWNAFVEGRETGLTTGAMIFIGYMAIMIILASLYMVGAIGKLKIHSRKFFILFLWFFIFCLAIYVFVPLAGPELLFFAAIPMSYLLAYYFMFCRRNWVNNLLLLLFFAAVAAVKIL